MTDFIYPAILTPDKYDDGFVVTFPDILESITQCTTLKDSLGEGGSFRSGYFVDNYR